jgi:hypothetical protein
MVDVMKEKGKRSANRKGSENPYTRALNDDSTKKTKKPMRLNNRFVDGLAAGSMWWDDEPQGFRLRGARLSRRRQIFLPRLSH